MSDRVFGVIQGTWGSTDVVSSAISESGHVEASWVSSSPAWAKHDLPRALPEGTIIDWVDLDDPRLPKPCSGCIECGEIE